MTHTLPPAAPAEPARLPWRRIGWGIAAAMVLAPAIAMRFTDEVNWTAADFALAALLLGGAGLLIELGIRASRRPAYRLAMALAALACLTLIWINLAVGIAGRERDPLNQIFMAPPLIVVLGALIARLRPRGMAVTMLAALAAQVLAAIIAASTDPLPVLAVTLILAPLWLTAAALFARP